MRIETRWFSGGIRGIVKRAVAPRMLRRVYRDQLELLDRYANGAATFAAQRKQRRGKRLQSLIRAKDLRRGAHPR